jgi:flagellar assembly protein FliH
MSLSNSNDDQFEQIAVNSLESFDQEHSNRTQRTKPDLDRFKALFEKPEFENQEADEFKALYEDSKEEEEEIVFEPLFDIKEESDSLDTSKRSDNSGGSDQSGVSGNLDEHSDDLDNSASSVEKELKEPEETPEAKGYREGFEKGLEKGREQGYEKGLKQGEEKGLETGEQKGFEQGKEQGLEQGIKLGEEKGEAQVIEDSAAILNSLENSLTTADQTLDLLVEKYETGIISLMEQIVKKIIMAHMQIDDEIVKPMILDALKTLVQAEEVVLSVSQEDYDYIEMIKDEFFETVDSLTSVSVKSDPSIKRGGCKIDTNTASISSDVESRLEAIFEAIKTAGIS